MTMKRYILTFTLVLAVFASATALAQDKIRTWRDASGKFEIRATLVEQTDKAVRLRKDDRRVVTVPLDQLSAPDLRYLKELKKEKNDNPFSGGEMEDPSAAPAASVPSTQGPDDVAELPTDGKPVYLNIDYPASAIAPDPNFADAKFAPFAVPIGEMDAYTRVSEPILVNAREPIFAVSAHRNKNASGPENYGNVVLVGPKSRTAKLGYSSPETFRLFDHNMKYDRSLGVAGVNSPSDRGGDLVLLDKLSTGKAKPIARWHLPDWDRRGFKPKVEFAKMLDATRALVKVNDTVYGWSLDTGQNWLKIDRVPATGKIATSGSGRYLAIAVSGGVQIIDAEKSESMGKIPFPSRLTPEIRFSPDGRRLGMAVGNQVAVWNLENAGMEMSETIQTHTGRLVGWVGNNRLLTQFGLIDLDLAQAIWQYNLPSSAKDVTIEGGFVTVNKNSRPTLVASLPMPHAAVSKLKLDRATKDKLLLGPGSSVQLRIDAVAGVDENAMEQALDAAVRKAGWKVDPQSDVIVIAEIKRGEKQSLNFRSLGSSIYGETEVVTLRPYRASLRVVRGATTLWQRSTQNMVPFIVRIKPGEKLQDAVKQYEIADPEYFRRVSIPPRVFKPEYRKTVGRSRVKNGTWVDY